MCQKICRAGGLDACTVPELQMAVGMSIGRRGLLTRGDDMPIGQNDPQFIVDNKAGGICAGGALGIKAAVLGDPARAFDIMSTMKLRTMDINCCIP